MMNEPGLLRSTDPETVSIGKLAHYEYGSEETNDIHADTDNLHDMFDVSLSMVPDIEGTLLCSETLSASGSDNDDLVLKQVSKRQRCVREHQHGCSNGKSSDKEDSGFNSSEPSSSPQQVPTRSITPSGSEADAEESDPEMDQNIEGTVHFGSLEMNSALFMSNGVPTIQRRNWVRNRETTGNSAILRNNDDSVVPSSPTFGASTLSGDAYVPYIDSDELVSDASSSDGDNGRHMYSCMNNDHVVPQIYIEE